LNNEEGSDVSKKTLWKSRKLIMASVQFFSRENQTHGTLKKYSIVAVI